MRGPVGEYGRLDALECGPTLWPSYEAEGNGQMETSVCLLDGASVWPVGVAWDPSG